MKNLLHDLYHLMEDRWVSELNGSSSYRECLSIQQRLFTKLEDGMGEEFCGKVRDITYEIKGTEVEAAFTWGLRLGLGLPLL